MDRPGVNRAEDAERMAKFLIQTIRGKLENFMNTPLIKAFHLRDILVKHNLGNIAKNRNASLIVSNSGGEGRGHILAKVRAPA